MRFTDVDIYGVLISPFVPMMVAAALLVGLLRWVMVLSPHVPRVWHPALFDFSLYIIVLCLIVLAVGAWNTHV